MHTYMGFYASWVLQLNSSLVYFALFIMFTLFQIGFCSYMDACVMDFETVLCDLSEFTIKNDGKINHHSKLAMKEAIRIHNDMLK